MALHVSAQVVFLKKYTLRSIPGMVNEASVGLLEIAPKKMPNDPPDKVDKNTVNQISKKVPSKVVSPKTTAEYTAECTISRGISTAINESAHAPIPYVPLQNSRSNNPFFLENTATIDTKPKSTVAKTMKI